MLTDTYNFRHTVSVVCWPISWSPASGNARRTANSGRFPAGKLVATDLHNSDTINSFVSVPRAWPVSPFSRPGVTVMVKRKKETNKKFPPSCHLFGGPGLDAWLCLLGSLGSAVLYRAVHTFSPDYLNGNVTRKSRRVAVPLVKVIM